MTRGSTLPGTREALRLLGSAIRLGRNEHRWTMEELARRVGVSRETMRKIEAGDESVATGAMFDAAVLVGVPLFDPDPTIRRLESERIAARIAVLPESVRTRKSRIDDNF